MTPREHKFTIFFELFSIVKMRTAYGGLGINIWIPFSDQLRCELNTRAISFVLFCSYLSSHFFSSILQLVHLSRHKTSGFWYGNYGHMSYDYPSKYLTKRNPASKEAINLDPISNTAHTGKRNAPKRAKIEEYAHSKKQRENTPTFSQSILKTN